eukprot:GFUD01002046.1.p1 GENE.GFUD01002046.1~~GFUD01002046.1.p1  ORF type:complete len:620 (-),score=114.31 GFUD01002046.1:44-1903(-)
MLMTVNCLLTASPSSQTHLASLMQSFNIMSTPIHSGLTVSTGSNTVCINVHPAFLCSHSPLLSSLLSSSSSPTTILLPSASPCSLPLAKELLYTGQCKGTLVQLEGAVQLLQLLGIHMQSEVVDCKDAGETIGDNTFFLACDIINNIVASEKELELGLPEVSLDNSRIVGLPFDETYKQDQFDSIIVSADEVSHTLNLNDIVIESLPSFYDKKVEKKSEYPVNLKKDAFISKDSICQQRSFLCNHCEYITSQEHILKLHKQVKHGGCENKDQDQSKEIGVNQVSKKEIKTDTGRQVFIAKTLTESQVEFCSGSAYSDILLSEEKCEYDINQEGDVLNDSEIRQERSNMNSKNRKETRMKSDPGSDTFDDLNPNKSHTDSFSDYGNSDILLSDDEAEKQSATCVKSVTRKSEVKGKRAYPCNHCGYVAKQKGHLKHHNQVKHFELEGLKQEQYPCNQCDYIATQNGHLKRHVLAKHSLERFECKLCMKTFALKDGLHRHVINFHENQTYPCPECKFVASRSDSLKYHIQFRHSEEKAICDECGYQAATMRLIKKHKLRKHEGMRYPCNMCDYQASEKTTLTHHINSTHEKIRHQCDMCIRKFTKKTSLKRHIIVKHSVNI